MPTRPPSFIQRLNAQRRAVGARRLDAQLREADADQAAVDRMRKTYRWRCIRAQVIRSEPFCRLCTRAGRTEIAVDVDHIEPIRARPELAFHLANLQPLCRPCHARKGAIERGLTPRAAP